MGGICPLALTDGDIESRLLEAAGNLPHQAVPAAIAACSRGWPPTVADFVGCHFYLLQRLFLGAPYSRFRGTASA